MPGFFRAIGDELKSRLNQKDTVPVNTFEGFQSNGAVVVRDRRGTLKAEIPDAEGKGFGGGSDPLAIYKPTGAKEVDASKAMMNFKNWSYAAVNAIASEVANIQFRLYQIKGDDQEELDDHPLLTLLDGVNEHMTGIELKYVTMAHLELAGNAYWLLDGVKDDVTPPRAIYVLNPGRVRVKLNKSSFPYTISHYDFTIDGKVYEFKPYQILHIKYPDPNDEFVGIGITQTIPVWIDSDNYAMEYNRKFFVNGAQVGMYIQTDTNVEANIDRIRKGFGNRHEGIENAHKVPVLPKGAKLEHTGVTQRDMDFNNLTEATRDRILAGHRVSKTILGTAESDTNRATAETADYVFSKRTIKPKIELVLSYLNEFLTPRYGDDLYLTFIDPVPEDKAFRTQEMQAAVGSMPLMTQNEARDSYLGLGPVPGGEQLMRPTSMMPAGETAEPEGDEIAPEAAPAGKPEKFFKRQAKTLQGWNTNPIRVRTGGKTANSGAAQMRRALTEAFKNKINKVVPDYKVKKVADLSHSEYMEHWKRFADRSEQAEAKLKEVFLGINKKQREEVIENLSKATGATKGLDELFDTKEWMGITIDLTTPIITSLAKDEAAAALAMIGAQNQDILANASTQAALDRGISLMARSYTETTLQQLKDVLGEKLTQPGGTNLGELTNAVDGVYDFADDRRAGLIAKTESFRAANFANLQAWKQSGVVQTVKWYTAEDDAVCPECEALDGKTVDIGADFFTADYGDGNQPPAHPSCRCYLRPDQISTE